MSTRIIRTGRFNPKPEPLSPIFQTLNEVLVLGMLIQGRNGAVDSGFKGFRKFGHRKLRFSI